MTTEPPATDWAAVDAWRRVDACLVVACDASCGAPGTVGYWTLLRVAEEDPAPLAAAAALFSASFPPSPQAALLHHHTLPMRRCDAARAAVAASAAAEAAAGPRLLTHACPASLSWPAASAAAVAVVRSWLHGALSGDGWAAACVAAVSLVHGARGAVAGVGCPPAVRDACPTEAGRQSLLAALWSALLAKAPEAESLFHQAVAPALGQMGQDTPEPRSSAPAAAVVATAVAAFLLGCPKEPCATAPAATAPTVWSAEQLAVAAFDRALSLRPAHSDRDWDMSQPALAARTGDNRRRGFSLPLEPR